MIFSLTFLAGYGFNLKKMLKSVDLMMSLYLFQLIIYASVYDYIKLHLPVCLMTGKVLLKRDTDLSRQFCHCNNPSISQPRPSEQCKLMVQFSLYNLHRLNVFQIFSYVFCLSEFIETQFSHFAKKMQYQLAFLNVYPNKILVFINKIVVLNFQFL